MTEFLKILATLNITAVLLLFALVVGILILVYAQLRKDAFDLRSLIIDPQTKQPSIHQLGQISALLISSWGFIVLVLHNQLTEVYFTTYMAVWAGANALDKLLTRDNSCRDSPQ